MKCQRQNAAAYINSSEIPYVTYGRKHLAMKMKMTEMK